MDEYLRNMKTLRSQMNDFEEEAANVSVDEQKQITAIQTVEKDLQSVLAETKHLKEETDEIVIAKGQLCCQILEKQKKISSLEIESATLSQTLDLLQQERVTLSEKTIEKSAFFKKVQKDLCDKLQDQQKWLTLRQAATLNVEECHDTKKVFIEGNVKDMVKIGSDSHGGKAVECNLATQLKSSTAKLKETMAKKSEVTSKISKSNQLVEQLKFKTEGFPSNQLVEQLKFKTEGFPAEVKGLDLKTLEHEHQALLADKAGEVEYLQSLKDQIEQVQGISEVVNCQCGEKYDVDLKGHRFGVRSVAGLETN